MNSEEFVQAIKAVCTDTLAKEQIRLWLNPPGRRPSSRLLRLSKWLNQLNRADQRALAEALTDTAESALFGLFCVLDGARAFESGPEKGRLELFYVKDDERILLNPENDGLHDLFQGLRSFE